MAQRTSSFRQVLTGRVKPNRFQTVAVRYLQKVTDAYGPIAFRQVSATGQASNQNGLITIKAPNPVNAGALYGLLHEVAHVLLGHTDRRKEATHNLVEAEAEIQALQWFEDEHIAVPIWVRNNAVLEVADAIKSDRRLGEPISRIAIEFVQRGGFV